MTTEQLFMKLCVFSQVVKLSEIVSLAKEAQVDITFQLPI